VCGGTCRTHAFQVHLSVIKINDYVLLGSERETVEAGELEIDLELVDSFERMIAVEESQTILLIPDGGKVVATFDCVEAGVTPLFLVFRTDVSIRACDR